MSGATGAMAHLFVSHSSADKALVRLIGDELAAAQLDVWLDERELDIGDRLTPTLQDAVRTARCLVLCLSPAARASRWVELEIAAAREAAIPILPILLGGIAVEDIPDSLRDIRFADLRAPAAYDRALRSVLVAVDDEVAEDVLALDDARSTRLIEHARRGLETFIVTMLVESLASREDPEERYWTYITLAEIGGSSARRAIENGLAESDQYARKGAEEAWVHLINEC